MAGRTFLGFSREVWILFAGTFVNRFGSFVLVFLVLYLTRRGYSAAEAGIAVAAYGAGAIGASIAGGHLADRVGRRGAIAVSMFSGAAAILALASVETYAAILALTALVGFTAELYRPASSALLVDLTDPARRVTAFAGLRLAVNLGAAIGPAIGGFIAERSFVWLFAADAVTCAAFGIIALTALPRGEVAPHEPGRSGALASIVADRAFMLFLAASVATSIVYAQIHAGLPLQVAALGFSNAAYGGLISLNGFVVILLELPLTRVTGRLPARPIVALGMLLIGLGFALTGLAPTVTLLAITVVVWTLGEIVGSPVSGAYVAALAPAHLRASYQGAWGMTFAIGYVLGPVVGGALFARGPGLLWGACAVLGVVAVALVISGRPERAAAPAPPAANQG